MNDEADLSVGLIESDRELDGHDQRLEQAVSAKNRDECHENTKLVVHSRSKAPKLQQSYHAAQLLAPGS